MIDSSALYVEPYLLGAVILAISVAISLPYLRDVVTRTSITPIRVILSASLFGITVITVGSVDVGAIAFIVCLFCSVGIVYPAYVRDHNLHKSDNSATPLHLTTLFVTLTALVLGLRIFPRADLLPTVTKTTGILLTYVGIAFVTAIFGRVENRWLVQTEDVCSNDPDEGIENNNEGDSVSNEEEADSPDSPNSDQVK